MAESFESQIRGGSRTAVRNVKRGLTILLKNVKNWASTWFRWLRRALIFIGIAAVLLVAERRLITAWKREGLKPLGTYVPLMLYVYGCLLTDKRTAAGGKILFVLAIVYGVVRADLIADRWFLFGLIDDLVVLALAVHFFRKSCPQSGIERWAGKAISWRQRVNELRRRTANRGAA